MPAYNAAGFIHKSIDSVRHQTYKKWELWIVNDASTDNTESEIKPYLADKRIHYISLERNSGVSEARNAGIRKSQGEYIAFLDADDLWLPEKLDRQVLFHLKYTDVGLSFTGYSFFDEAGERSSPAHLRKNKKNDLFRFDASRLNFENMIGTLTVMVRKEILDRTGYFDPNLRSAEDHDLWFRIAKAGYQFGYLEEKLALYRLSFGSLSRSLGKYKSQRKKFLRKHFPQVTESSVSKKAWGTYYRHFGSEYSQRKDFCMARMYYFRSLKCFGISKAGFLMLYFYLRSSIKSIF